MKKEFINSTMGLRVYHPSYKSHKLVRCEFYRTNEGILLQAVHGESLNPIKSIKTVLISRDDYNDREHCVYDDQVEFEWAMNILECSI